MLLASELVGYLSRRLVQRLNPGVLEIANPAGVAEAIGHLITHDLGEEDRLNDEVRETLSQYTEYMRQNGVGYQDMFRKVKNNMIRERKLVRANGRDSGDGMKLSRDKITDLSHQILSALRKSRDVRIRRDPNDVRLQIVGAFTELLQLEEKVDKAARDKIRSQKREILEGAEEWDILHRRYYAEELKRFGIDLNS
jgi:uncharacterized protein